MPGWETITPKVYSEESDEKERGDKNKFEINKLEHLMLLYLFDSLLGLVDSTCKMCHLVFVYFLSEDNMKIGSLGTECQCHCKFKLLKKTLYDH